MAAESFCPVGIMASTKVKQQINKRPIDCERDLYRSNSKKTWPELTMLKSGMAVLIAALILVIPIYAGADSNEIEFFLANNCESKTMVLNVKGVENTDLNEADAAIPGSYAKVKDWATAWFLSATTYRWDIGVYSTLSSAPSVDDMEKMAEIKVTARNMYLLWPELLQFYVEKSTVYYGEVSFELKVTDDWRGKVLMEAK